MWFRDIIPLLRREFLKNLVLMQLLICMSVMSWPHVVYTFNYY